MPKTPPVFMHTTIFLINNHCFVAQWFLHMGRSLKMASLMRPLCQTSKLWKSDGLVNVTCCCFVWKSLWKSQEFWTSPPEEEEKKKKKQERRKTFWLTFWFCTFAMLFFAPVGVVFIIKTLKNEWYVVKANKFTTLRFWGIFFVLSSTVCPHYPYIRVYQPYN